jgi:hypothetical protein
MNERKKEKAKMIYLPFFLTFTCKLEEGGDNWGKVVSSVLHFLSL